ncbi:unnamed protein product [Alopecurus aequalis]
MQIQVAKMSSEIGVSPAKKKRKSPMDNGGDPRLASPCKQGEEGSGRSSDDAGQSEEQLASNWAQSVVSLTTSSGQGGSVQPACTGIVFEHTKLRAYLLTSLGLFRSTDDDGRISYFIKSKVRLPNNQVVKGTLVFHDLKRNLAVASVLPQAGCVRAACLDHQQQKQPEPHGQVVAVRRCFSSGKLMAATGTLASDPTGAYLQEAAAEGLLISSLGKVVGLNCYGKEGTTFIPRSTMLEFLAVFQKTGADERARSADLRRSRASRWKLKPWSPSDMSCLEGSSRMEKKQSACHYCDPEVQSAHGDRFKHLFRDHPSWPVRGDSVSKEAARNRLRSRGYPFPLSSDCGMRLLCNFEEEFAEDIWSKLTKRVASDMSPSVVALASFNGDKRFFACTGIVIGCNDLTTRVLTSASLVRDSDDEAKLADNLKIEVCLPDNEHGTGTLQHYNLRYNIAVISIMCSHCTQTAQIYDQLQTEPRGEVVAVGRVYESGKLMATGGTLIDKPSELDCKELKMSTCKITKTGIGGPLIDCEGKFIGMNFYGLDETLYLPRNVVLEVLRSFDAKPDATDLIDQHNPNRWPVPKPFWCYPSWHDSVGEDVIIDHRPRNM